MHSSCGSRGPYKGRQGIVSRTVHTCLYRQKDMMARQSPTSSSRLSICSAEGHRPLRWWWPLCSALLAELTHQACGQVGELHDDTMMVSTCFLLGQILRSADSISSGDGKRVARHVSCRCTCGVRNGVQEVKKLVVENRSSAVHWGTGATEG